MTPKASSSVLARLDFRCFLLDVLLSQLHLSDDLRHFGQAEVGGRFPLVLVAVATLDRDRQERLLASVTTRGVAEHAGGSEANTKGLGVLSGHAVEQAVECRSDALLGELNESGVLGEQQLAVANLIVSVSQGQEHLLAEDLQLLFGLHDV